MDNKETSSTLVSRIEIPIIDLENKVSIIPTSELLIKEKANQLKQALSGCGLALLINHGIAEERVQAVHKIMDTFYALPDDVKNHYKLGPPDYNQGYIPAGSEKLDGKEKIEERYCYNITNLSGKLPTEEIPNFIEVIGGVAEDFLNISQMLLNVIAVMLELDPDLFLSFHKGMMKEDNCTTLRMHYYPALGEGPVDNTTRCGAHTDWGTFTLLIQDSSGLEVLNGSEWKSVGEFPGAILLNLGDMMEIWTSSQYRAIKHRVTVPNDTKLRTRCRHSLAFFVHPDDSVMADPWFLTQCRSGEKVDKPKSHILTALAYAMKKRGESYRIIQ